MADPGEHPHAIASPTHPPDPPGRTQPVGKARRGLVPRPEPGGGRGCSEVFWRAPWGAKRRREPHKTAFESLGCRDAPVGWSR
jgi:hypothetical protein